MGLQRPLVAQVEVMPLGMNGIGRTSVEWG